jgi:hypothetical protein
VQAAWLLQLGLAFPGRLQAVEPDGRWREEPERIEVGAADLVGLDDRVRSLLAEAEGDPVPGAGVAVDHRPLVETEAPGEGGPARRGGEQPAHEPDGVTPVREESRGVESHGSVGSRGVPAPGAVRSRSPRGRGQHGPRTRVPPSEPARRLRVVGEEEVEHRVCLAPAAALPVRRGPAVDPDRVRLGQRRPLVRDQLPRRSEAGVHGARVGGGQSSTTTVSRCSRNASCTSSARSGEDQSLPSSRPTRSSRWVTVFTWTRSSSAARAGELPARK